MTSIWPEGATSKLANATTLKRALSHLCLVQGTLLMSASRSSLRRLAYISIPTAGVAFAWYNSPTLREIVSDVTAPVFGQTIRVPWRVRGPDGNMVQTTKRFPRLPDDVVDIKLREHALGQTTRRPGGISESGSLMGHSLN
jgi:hypothetical protein